MFLPLLLMRDFGSAAFWVFMIPNALGAAAMGVVLSRESSLAAVLINAPQLRAFSTVTIAFQCFFLAWLLARFEDAVITAPWVLPSATTAMGVFGILLALLPKRIPGWPLVAATTLWSFSACVLIAALAAPDGSLAAEADLPASAPQGRLDLVFLAPAVVFGFLLCPYLDPTFHRARRAFIGAGGAWAFLIGFLVLFVAMIALTTVYRPMVSWYLGAGQQAAVPWLALLVLIHITTQLVFTLLVHDAEMPRPGGSGAFVTPIVAVLAFGLGFGIAPDYGDMCGEESVYRVFMAFYGLIFPAYVWLVMLPTPDRHSGLIGQRGRKKLRVWAFCIGVAAPMYWLGFLEREEIWLVPGLGVVLLGRLFLPGRRGEARHVQPT